MANNSLDDLIRHALSVAFTTSPVLRQRLFALLPQETFKGPALYFKLGRFFATDTVSENYGDIAKAVGLDPVELVTLSAEDESFRPLHEHLIRLLSARQSAAQNIGEDITRWAEAITKISEAAKITEHSVPDTWPEPVLFGEIQTPEISCSLLPGGSVTTQRRLLQIHKPHRPCQ